jgi:hypothetical protein
MPEQQIPEKVTPVKLALIPDANLFLQCKAIKSLDWHEIADADEIVVYIGRTLQREIDALKSDGNQRRARRAREANSFFKALLRAPNRTMALRVASPSVAITFMPPLDPERSKPPSLDLAKPDDCNVEEALAFRAANPGFRTAILTHDTGPVLTATEFCLDHVDVPDRWLLEPEKDHRQKQIEDLNRQIKILQRQFPQTVVTAEDTNGETIQALTLKTIEYESPVPGQVESVVGDLRDRYPLQVDFGAPPQAVGRSVRSGLMRACISTNRRHNGT